MSRPLRIEYPGEDKENNKQELIGDLSLYFYSFKNFLIRWKDTTTEKQIV